VNPSVAARVAALVFMAALVQGVVVSSIGVAGGTADVLLVCVIAVGLVRGSVVGALAGFGGGIVLDLLTLDTLGITSLVLTLAGFWAGRYAETTPFHGRRLAPLIAVGVLAPLAALFAFALHYMLGDEVVARYALVTSLLPSVVLNLVLALPVYALVRRVVGVSDATERLSEVEVVV
jgi:rod shape-determining protein MreD